MIPHVWTWPAAIVRVVDGDTLDVRVDRGWRNRQAPERVRLLGVNCPEIVGPDRAKGQAAAKFVVEWLTETGGEWPLLIQTFKPREADAFGRWLVLLWRTIDGDCLNDAIVAAGHGVPARA